MYYLDNGKGCFLIEYNMLCYRRVTVQFGTFKSYLSICRKLHLQDCASIMKNMNKLGQQLTVNPKPEG